MAQLHVVLSDAEDAVLRERAWSAKLSKAAFVRSLLFPVIDARPGMKTGGDMVMPDGLTAGEHIAAKTAARRAEPLVEKPPLTGVAPKADKVVELLGALESSVAAARLRHPRPAKEEGCEHKVTRFSPTTGLTLCEACPMTLRRGEEWK